MYGYNCLLTSGEVNLQVIVFLQNYIYLLVFRMELLACILFVNQLKTIYKAFKILIRYLFFPILGYNGNWKRKKKRGSML